MATASAGLDDASRDCVEGVPGAEGRSEMEWVKRAVSGSGESESVIKSEDEARPEASKGEAKEMRRCKRRWTRAWS